MMAAALAAAAVVRAVSLDPCADQYLLSLADRTQIAGLSARRTTLPPELAPRAAGLPRLRGDRESMLKASPQVVVRYWGGDAGLLRALGRRGIRVVALKDATDFEGIADNVFSVAQALGQKDRGRSVLADMHKRLAAHRGAGRGREVVYLTAAGFTSGPGTLVDGIIRAAGYTNRVRRPGYGPAPVEAMLIDPPERLVLGFFESDGDRWGGGRHPALSRLFRTAASVRLPESAISCPAPSAAAAVEALAGGFR